MARAPRHFLLLLFTAAALHAAPDVLDEHSRLQMRLDGALLDLHGERWTPADWSAIDTQRVEFARTLADATAKNLWSTTAAVAPADGLAAAQSLGEIRAVGQHVAALEMLAALGRGEIERAREWRAVIQLPKYASAVDGALALQRLGGDGSHRAEVGKLLAREFVIWQLTRAREKVDSLERLVGSGRATPGLVAARAAEIDGLAAIPAAIMEPVGQPALDENLVAAQRAVLTRLLAALREPNQSWATQITPWRLAMEATLPNLLGQEDVERRERVILKLLRLIPMEYRSGVRDGEITIPLEYREAKSFTVQAQQIVSELMPVWRQAQPDALKNHGSELLAALNSLEEIIERKGSVNTVDDRCKEVAGILQREFGLAAKRAGRASDAVAEAVLEIRSLLGQSLAAAQAGQWRKAETLRLDAYINFDLEIEARTLPRDPTLALRAERLFLDGERNLPGIKAALDARAKREELTAAYDRALVGLDECAALLKVGLSQGAAITSAIVIVLREGLEAVIILAAILAGLRGPANAPIRRRVAGGAWLALLTSALLFVVSQHLLAGLSRYGETLEAVISTLAVIVLAIVTNWVFHKVYWVGWNAKLREMSKAAQAPKNPRIESLALVGVGFMTIFREGFETTLFLQSLILEAGLRSVSIGLGVAGLLIAALGYAVFWVGAHLPYRRMMIYTGVLVVAVMFTFVGSTTRIFQTIGWLPVHPVPGLELPNWVSVWFGLYPSWEGLLMPLLTFVYVGGMWFYAKASARAAARKTGEVPQDEDLPRTKTAHER